VSVARRLKFSNAEAEQLTAWALQSLVPPHMDESELSKALYLGNAQAHAAKLKLEIARLGSLEQSGSEDVIALAQLCKHISKWKRPHFPLKGQDLLDAGKSVGPEIGKELKRLETAWLESDFKLSRNALLEMI